VKGRQHRGTLSPLETRQTHLSHTLFFPPSLPPSLPPSPPRLRPWNRSSTWPKWKSAPRAASVPITYPRYVPSPPSSLPPIFPPSLPPFLPSSLPPSLPLAPMHSAAPMTSCADQHTHQRTSYWKLSLAASSNLRSLCVILTPSTRIFTAFKQYCMRDMAHSECVIPVISRMCYVTHSFVRIQGSFARIWGCFAKYRSLLREYRDSECVKFATLRMCRVPHGTCGMCERVCKR